MTDQDESMQLSIDGRVWLCLGQKVMLGKGRIELLIKIKDLGSLRKAATEMKMSYRQAWQEINLINQYSQKPIVILHRGGRQGGQALLTPWGQQLIESFHQTEKAFEAFKKELSTFLH
ncbi:MAG: winged helix-turn-helix domain-containing protein [Bacteroidales bacterium]